MLYYDYTKHTYRKGNTLMQKITGSIRVSADRWEDEKEFEALLSLLHEYRDSIQQVAFFTTYFHPPMPLAMAKRMCGILTDRVKRVKALGISCGLNILATVGHHPECMDEAAQGDWAYMTNIDGEVCLGSRCLNDRRYLEEYVRPLYEIHCAVHPDFIWIDDDIRYGHLPVGGCCYCQNCLDRFNRDYGYAFDRPQLKKALNDPEQIDLRKAWLTHQSDKIADLLAFIRQVVNACDDQITLGLMTGERYLEGYDFARWAHALSDGGKYDIMWRPGGGNYTDAQFGHFLWKSSEVGRQNAHLPAYVTSIQSEIENHPRRLLKKGPRYTALEALMHMSAGCTGAAFNILPLSTRGEPIDLIRGHLDAIRAVTPFMQRLNPVSRRPIAGIHCGWHIHDLATVDGAFNDSYGGYAAMKWQEMYEIGLPEGFDFAHASAFLLTGRAPYAFTEEELLSILSRGVYMDGGAVQSLCDMGYGDLVGFTVGRSFEDGQEVYTDHPINQGFAGKCHDMSQIFGAGDMLEMIPAPGAQILGSLQDRKGNVLAPCVTGLYRNRLGGTVCAAGYYPASELTDFSKYTQLHRIFRLLSSDTLPALVESYARIRVIAHAGAPAVTLLNTTPDHLKNVSVLVAGDAAQLILYDERNTATPLRAAGTDGRMTRFVIPEIRPLEMVLLADQ